jgi:hypothetical protein
MKAIALVQRRRQQRAGPAISLFPFLAVLICTMGALVPLFLAIARQARIQAVREAAAKAAQQHDDTRAEVEMAQWRVEQLKDSRQKTEKQLGEARMALGHIEDHTRRLRQRAAELKAKWEELEKSGQQGLRQRSELEAELASVRKELAEAQRELGDAKLSAAERPRSYAIIPFQGPNQTRRRPIYVECTATAVILQPEGIALSPADFEGPPGPGNPLAAALRAEREYMLRDGLDPQQVGEPYPLLLVRPDGIVAYWATRAALKTWGSDFGYELIDDDWTLAFPPADAQLAQEIREALQQSRIRQQRVIASAPRAYGTRSGGGGSGGYPPGGYVTGAPAGTFAGRFGSEDGGGGVGGSGDAGGVSGGSRSAPPGGTSRGTGGGDRYGTGGTGTGGGDRYGTGSGSGSGSDRYTTSGTGSGDRYGTGSGSGSDRYTTPGTGSGDRYGTGGTGAGGSGTGGAGDGGRYGTGGSGNGAGGGTSGGNSGGTSSGNSGGTSGGSSGGTGQRPDGMLKFMPPGEATGARPGDSDGARGGQPGEMLRPGEWRPTPPAPPAKPPKDDKADENDKLDRRGKPYKKPKSLAATHGLDWALRNAAAGATPIARPIRVVCQADRLVILPDRGNAGGKVIPLDRHTEDAIGPFVSTLQTHIESWGMAGNRMYWRPVLQVQVASGAEERFHDLSVLLEGSGLNVERKMK